MHFTRGRHVPRHLEAGDEAILKVKKLILLSCRTEAGLGMPYRSRYGYAVQKQVWLTICDSTQLGLLRHNVYFSYLEVIYIGKVEIGSLKYNL